MVVDCACKQTDMDVIKFNNHLNKIVKKVSKEQKKFFFLEISILICLIIMYISLPKDFDSIIPFILQPIRLTSQSKTLIDNVSLNLFSSNIISENLTAPISDHLPQFLICPY